MTDTTHDDLARCIRTVGDSVTAMGERLDHHVAAGRARIEMIEGTLSGNQSRFTKIENTLERLGNAMEPIPRLCDDVAATREIVEALQGLKTLGRACKWVAGVGAALAVILGGVWAFAKVAIGGMGAKL